MLPLLPAFGGWIGIAIAAVPVVIELVEKSTPHVLALVGLLGAAVAGISKSVSSKDQKVITKTLREEPKGVKTEVMVETTKEVKE